MKLSDIGEEALIERIAKMNILPKSAPGLLTGAGDDCAVLAPDASGMLTLVTTDMLTERMDFLLGIITPYQLGWKSTAANISDIAAMGGTPTFTFASVGFRSETEVAFVEEFFRGIAECAGRFGSVLAGGDTNAVLGDYTINITQMGRVPKGRIAQRTGARPGDRILVTGWLGNSRGGLELLLKNGLDESARLSAYLVEAHLMPIPRVLEGIAAMEAGGVHAMMDLSDGLGADLPKLCAANNLGALVYLDELPISADLKCAADTLGIDARALAAGGGEEFELLMAVPPEDAEDVKSAIEERTGTQVTEIGEIVEGRSVSLVSPDGNSAPIQGGWEHFT